jgi:hypothetical protein
MKSLIASTAPFRPEPDQTQDRILWKEAFVIVRELPAFNVSKGVQCRSQRHALRHSRKEKVYPLAVALDKRTGRRRWRLCRGRRWCRPGAADNRAQCIQNLIDLGLRHVPLRRHRALAVSDNRARMRVQAKRPLDGVKPCRLVVARKHRDRGRRPICAQQRSRQRDPDLVDCNRKRIGQARLVLQGPRRCPNRSKL